ncbi:peptidase inhibitor family I36 protein [Methylococcus geothermalis]|uniref:Uncharacterized protein n=1 Tax=Methylococcus geothermalis TaxID=2681310 RepID=A0A858Q450_9GAMM|nr:peptidase inhibitor family I36 protein [Methylococcus geothermalis]QJD28594.1 hypothetical protein GNH96_00495 [Methylococcus geothermalis]
MKMTSAIHPWLTILVFVAGGSAASAAPRSGSCWVDVYNGPDFTGTQVRIFGPTELASLKNLQGADWNDAIESLEVGPGAEVSVYGNENFALPSGPVYHEQEIRSWGNKDENYRSQVATFTAGHKVHHLGEYGLHDQVSALKVRCMD